MVTARYLVVTTGYCSLPGGYARYHLLLLVPTFSMNALKSVLLNLKILCLQFHLFYFRYFNCAQNILSRIQFKEFKRGSVTSSSLECYFFT